MFVTKSQACLATLRHFKALVRGRVLRIVFDFRRLYDYGLTKFFRMHLPGSGSEPLWEETTMNQLALCRDARTVACAACLALLVAGGMSTPAKADDDMRSSPPDTNSYSR